MDAACCFTPVLVVALGVLGISAAVGWLDYVLLPAFSVFAGTTVYALVRLRRPHSSTVNPTRGIPDPKATRTLRFPVLPFL
jgi:mercuric ion transport protein